jgi:hypothetical protein
MLRTATASLTVSGTTTEPPGRRRGHAPCRRMPLAPAPRAAHTAAMRGRRLVALVLFAAAVLAIAAAAVVIPPRIALERAKDPGLGVRALHAAGVTGAGVGVAVIDGQIRVDHVEYAHALVHYEELDDFTGGLFDAHGPAMASLLVGRDVGVAPEARLHYFALDFSRATPERLAAAIDRVLERNGELPRDDRVRTLAVSTGFRGADEGVVLEAIERAIAHDVFVLFSVYPVDYLDPPLAIRSLGCPPGRDCDRPEHFVPSPGTASHWREQGVTVEELLERRAASDAAGGYVTLYAPAHHRTVAGPRDARAYTYDVEGGDSEWPPYLTGLLALALQVAPELHARDLAGLLAEGATSAPHGARLIDPARVVDLARRRAATTTR